MRGGIHAATISLALVLLAAGARAQPRDVAKADALFKEGRALMKTGDYETACPKLEESYQLDPAAGTGINLGDCFEKRGKVASALIAYQAARALLKPGDPRIGPVEREISALEKRTPRLTIKLAPGAPDGTTVKRDGRELGPESLGVALPVNPGEHWVVVAASGRLDARRKVTVPEGRRREIVVEVGERAGGSEPEGASTRGSHSHSGESHAGGKPRVEESDGSAQRTSGLVVGGAGVVALGVGALFWSQAQSKYEEAGCDPTCPKNSPLADEGDEKQTSATWTAGLGLAALAGGLVLVLTAPGAPRDSARLQIAPAMTLTHAGVRLGAEWW